MFKQWFYMVGGISFTYVASDWPGLEAYLASLALLFFALAFRCDIKQAK